MVVHLLFVRPSERGWSIEVSERRALDAEGNCASIGWVHREWIGAAQHRARWLKIYTYLTDLVTGEFTVERLIAKTLLDRPDNPMLSHAGD